MSDIITPMPRVLPCPFCGNDMADMGKADDPLSFARLHSTKAFSVNCGSCRATGPFEPTMLTAILSWNRAHDAP